LSEEFIAAAAGSLQKLPSEMKEEYMNMGLTQAEATMLVDQAPLRIRFDAIKESINDAKRASSIVLTQMTGFLKQHNTSLDEAPSPASLVELALVMQKGTISTNTGKDVLEKMILTGKSPATIIKDEGMGQVSDDATLQKLVEEGVKLNPKAIESFRAGKTQALGAIVGWVMKQTKGQADAAKVQELLKKSIG
jgi:aspartyl-tRNA(Asn)/glutamyl-tRNA(Gln) amidotransferase subunit B